MKMPENMTCWPPFSRQECSIGGNLAFAMAYLRADIMLCVYNSNRTQRCRPLSPSSFRDLLDFAGLSSNLAGITSVFIGYIGTDLDWSANNAAKKAGVEDGRNQLINARRLICWRGRDPITDVRNQKSWL